MHSCAKILSNSQITNWIKKQTEWATKLAHTKVQIMCPDGDWSDGTVVATVEGLVKHTILLPTIAQLFEILKTEESVVGACYSMEADGTKLKKALVKTKMIQWQKFSHFSAVVGSHAPICVYALQEIGVISQTVPCHMFYLPAEEAANIEVPE
jgi:hypothetical protein